MKQDLEKLFTHLKSPEPSAGLFDKVMLRIKEEGRVLTLKRRVVIFSIAVVGCLFAFIPAFNAVRAEFAQSGFLQFLSLVFFDPGAVLASWSDFVLSLLESIPVLSIAASLAIIFVFLGLIKLLARDIMVVFARQNFR